MAWKLALFIVSVILWQRGACELWIDCHPDKADSYTQQVCAFRGCTYSPKTVPNAPWCTFSDADDPNKMAGYDASDEIKGTGSNIYAATLTRRYTNSVFGADYQTANIKIEQLTNEIVHVLVTDDKGNAKPAKYPDWQENLKEAGSGKKGESPLDVKTDKSPFGFAVVRRSTGVPLIDSRQIPGFTFAEQYMQLSTRVPSQYVYGLGEMVRDTLKHDFNYQNWGLFTRDTGPGWGISNLYGVHAFYLCIDDHNGNAHGVFFLNTHALSVSLQPDPSDPLAGIITWRAIGGAMELFVFSGPTPDDVIRQYTSIIGRPQLPPYWAMGFQLSKYGYKNLDHVNTVFQRNRRAGIPQDTQVLDIDYMYQYLDFTVDPVTFANFSGFIQSLHNQYNMKLVLIVDPGIPSRPQIHYDPLETGKVANIFIRDNRTGQPLEGSVWPGDTYYPDFTNPAAIPWWTTAITDFYNKQNIHFDGLWIDMNEPSDFQVGSLTGCARNKYTYPPYNPILSYSDLNEKTVCLDADQYAGKHYEYHNLYGFTEAQATYSALQTLFPNKRPFILSRSTFAGSGKFTNHWLGDNTSAWNQLKQSIIGMLEFNLFGIPLVGADTCGFLGDSNEELCVRWSQTGAFYPFSRNHNGIDAKQDQDPAAWSPQGTTIIRNMLNTRYSLLPYLYTLLHQAHMNGTPVARPMFFDYANDSNTREISDQFMWGKGLMVAPITDPNTNSRLVYFPRGRWYDFMSYFEITRPDTGRAINMPMPIDTLGLYLRGGSILPWQIPGVNTVRSRNNDFSLIVALDEYYRAHGSMFWDDGETMDGPSSAVKFEAWSSKEEAGINITSVRNDFPIDPVLNSVRIYGMQQQPGAITVDDVPVPQSARSVEYDPKSKSLKLANLGLDLNKSHSITWHS